MATFIPPLEDLRRACVGNGELGMARDLFQSLLKAIIAPSSLQNEAKDRIMQIKAQLKENPKISDIVLDVIWLETSMIETENGKSTYPEPLIDLLKSLVRDIPTLHGPLLEILDASLLKMIGITESEPDLQKKIRLTNTQQYYRQHKFNLLVEESEGFAKFLYTVCMLLNDRQIVNRNERGSAILLRLIGTFSLDPNRCLDILLDVLDRELEAVNSNVSNKSTTSGSPSTDDYPRLKRLLQLINGMPLDKLPALLAFKLGRCQDMNRILCSSAFLVLHEVLNLSEFLTWLPEWADVLESAYNATKKQERETVKAMGRVKLSSASSKNTDEQAKGVDLSSLNNHPATRLILLLLRWNQFSLVEGLFQPYWSMICCLFPDTFGCLICDVVMDSVNEMLKGEQQALWTKQSQLKPESALSMEEILLTSVQKLEYTRDSGCIVLRPGLYCKICRLLAGVLVKERPSEEFINFLRSFILPSLGLFKSHPSFSQEVWKIIEHFPYQTRYSLYSSWRGIGLERNAILSDKPLWLIQGEILAGKDARHALKRLSKDTIRDACRAIAKVCHSHPLVVFSTILGQIESYDNLVQVMVDALRFATPLSLDVLAYCILGRLDGTGGGVNRSRLKDDGVNVSQWLQSLESFIGALYKHFPALELGGIMTYLMERVSTGHVMELGVLRMLLKESGGWAFADYAPAASLSSTQLEGRAGSTLLKRETMSFGVFQRFNKKASASVRRVLLNDDIGVKLLVLLSQLPNQIIFETKGKPSKPVKLIGNLVDTCQVTTSMLLGFLTDASHDNTSSDSATQGANDISSFAKSLPSLLALHDEYELDVASAWMLVRPLLRSEVALSTGDNSSEVVSTAVRPPDLSQEFKDSMQSRKISKLMSFSLFEYFYSFTLYDVCCPEDIYKSEIDRLEKEEERINRQKSSFPLTTTHGRPNLESDDAGELARVKNTAALLAADLKNQKVNVASCKETIASKAGIFFAPEINLREAASLFFCACVYPRCMKGPDDALYCARFVLLLHSLQVPGFSTMHLLDILTVATSKSLFGLTEGEAANVSILLNELWMTVSKWRYDENEFNSGLGGKVGSKMVDEGDNSSGEITSISYQQFIQMYNKWHAAIGMTALGCLNSKEYIHARNALIVLTRMVGSFPTRPCLANKLLSDLQPMQDENFPFADLRASAQAYSIQLLKARDEGVWKEESAEAVKARLSKEKAAAAARQKKAEEQMEQLKLDSEKITEEIGEKESWGRGERRGPYRSLGLDDSRAARGNGSGVAVSDSRSTHSTPPIAKDRVVSHHRDATGSTRDDSRAAKDRVPTARNDPPSSLSGTPPAARRESEQDSRARGLEGRWQKAPNAEPNNRGAKRSRPPSPADPGEIIQEDGGRNKRPRPDTDDSRHQVADDSRKGYPRRRRR
ncbi:hypothetical protein ACA910_003320 [Epithemia clementina (nom. ined.)]